MRPTFLGISLLSLLATPLACGGSDSNDGDSQPGDDGALVGGGGTAGTGDGAGGSTNAVGGTSTVEGIGGTGVVGAGGAAQAGSGGALVEGVGGDGSIVDGQVGTVDFTPLPTSFQGTIEVSLSTTLTGDIHYTIDGTPPTVSSPIYSAPLTLSATTQVRVVVFNSEGIQAGDAGSGVYLALANDITSDIPIVVLDNYVAGPVVEQGGGFGGPAAEREYVDATFMSFPVKADGVASLLDPPEVATRAAFRVRGQSSATFEKTPYKVELRDNDDTDKKFPVFGMPKQSDWVLRGPYADKSLIRDAFFYGLGAEMGLQAPKFVMAELYLNTDNAAVDSNDYMGVYIFSENVKLAKQRLDLQELAPTDVALPEITGGYIFKFEWKVEFPEEQRITCTGAAETCWMDLEVYDPDPINAEQNAWLSGHLNDFHNALFSGTWTDATAGYAPYIDMASFIDQLIINELGREMDSYVRSAYFHKDREGLITAGPLWDYNLSFGVGGYFGNQNTQGWQYIQNCSDDEVLMQADLDLGSTSDPPPDPEGTGGGPGGFPGGAGVQVRAPGNNWFLRMMDDPAFVAQVKARWQELRVGLLSDVSLEARVSALTVPLTAAAARNFQKWDTVLDTESIGVGFNTEVGPWDQQVVFLRSWMLERAAWIDTQWGQ